MLIHAGPCWSMLVLCHPVSMTLRFTPRGLEVTVVSPRPFFFYTPLLVGSTTGVVSPGGNLSNPHAVCTSCSAATVRSPWNSNSRSLKAESIWTYLNHLEYLWIFGIFTLVAFNYENQPDKLVSCFFANKVRDWGSGGRCCRTGSFFKPQFKLADRQIDRETTTTATTSTSTTTLHCYYNYKYKYSTLHYTILITLCYTNYV